MTFPKDILDRAHELVDLCRRNRMTVVTAESCTGGLVAGAITEIAGSSDVFDRGFVTYSNDAKSELLGVSAEMLARHGAVSAETAQAMAEGALKRSAATVGVSVTGIAGPGGGSDEKPIGLVHFAACRRGGAMRLRTERYGNLSRRDIRLRSVTVALDLLIDQAAGDP